MSKKLTMPKPVKGYGYSGVWSFQNQVGWSVAQFVNGAMDRKYPSLPAIHSTLVGQRLFLCEITIKPLKDKKGRPITKIMK